jgi:hypothetical protein
MVTVAADSRTADGTFVQPAAGRTDYAIDWPDWLEGGDVITDSRWSAPTGLTVVSSSFDYSHDIGVVDRWPGGGDPCRGERG